MPHWLLYPALFIAAVVVVFGAVLWFVSWGLGIADQADMDAEE